ncbi:dual specificity protein phosphatase family protein [Tundrisphaera lichenicola]|uniref:dual specificity protein phosphatase family protein n=1 Tax=Tundrisphaera lichenicola TaxID=2029860 RepID=UPI003EBEE704
MGQEHQFAPVRIIRQVPSKARTIDQISPHPIWVGHHGDGSNVRALHESGIEAVVQVAVEEAPLSPPRGLMYHRFPIVDGPGNDPSHLFLAVNTVASLLRRRIPTLVCCGMGLSRSPAIVAVALATIGRESPEEALRRLADRRPVDISPFLWSELRSALAIPPDLGSRDDDPRT